MSRPSLDNLIAALEVDFARLAECLLSPGSRLAINGNGALGIHYSLADRGG
jgi:AraC family transcriptional activator of mtrCDE